MKILFVVLSFFVASITAEAKSVPVAVQNAMKTLKSQHVRTIPREINITKKVPCLPMGKSYDVEIQVSRAIAYNDKTMELTYTWDTVKTVNVSLDGKITEVCIGE